MIPWSFAGFGGRAPGVKSLSYWPIKDGSWRTSRYGCREQDFSFCEVLTITVFVRSPASPRCPNGGWIYSNSCAGPRASWPTAHPTDVSHERTSGRGPRSPRGRKLPSSGPGASRHTPGSVSRRWRPRLLRASSRPDHNARSRKNITRAGWPDASVMLPSLLAPVTSPALFRRDHTGPGIQRPPCLSR